MRAKRIRSLRDIERRRRRPWLLFTVLGISLLFISLLVSYRLLRNLLVLEKVVVRGNQVLTERELMKLSGLKPGTSLLEISGSQVYHRLLSSPWIKEAVVRKELHDRIVIWIEEARPEAIIKKERSLYLIDERGFILEELRDQDHLLLPVIDMDYENKELLREALSLVKTMKRLNISPGESTLYLTGANKEDLTLIISGITSGPQDVPPDRKKIYIKIGSGNYDEKLLRLIDFAPSIKQKGLKPLFIDLRFKDRVIVKEQMDG